MTHRLPCFTPRRRFLVVLGFGWLAGLTALDAPAAPPAPVAPIVSAVTRFTNNGNGTVTDGMTGLIWLRNANCTDTVGGVNRPSGYLTWADALTWTAALANGACGLTDDSTAGQWRLPNRNELQSLIDYSTSGPALPTGHPFVGVRSSFYWSSTTFAPNPSKAWFVHLNDGIVYGATGDKTDFLWVWPVRGGL